MGNQQEYMVQVEPLPAALVKRAMPHGIPDTVRKLQSLRPDESICYYIGRLDEDIDRSALEAPAYHDLLERIKQTALVLERMRRITLTRCEVRLPCRSAKKRRRRQDVRVHMYCATGVRLS